eukprot:scaffold522947_cov45-Prasinocladus_malaysianus.AAC.1
MTLTEFDRSMAKWPFRSFISTRDLGAPTLPQSYAQLEEHVKHHRPDLLPLLKSMLEYLSRGCIAATRCIEESSEGVVSVSGLAASTIIRCAATEIAAHISASLAETMATHCDCGDHSITSGPADSSALLLLRPNSTASSLHAAPVNPPRQAKENPGHSSGHSSGVTGSLTLGPNRTAELRPDPDPEDTHGDSTSQGVAITSNPYGTSDRLANEKSTTDRHGGVGLTHPSAQSHERHPPSCPLPTLRAFPQWRQFEAEGNGMTRLFSMIEKEKDRFQQLGDQRRCEARNMKKALSATWKRAECQGLGISWVELLARFDSWHQQHLECRKGKDRLSFSKVMTDKGAREKAMSLFLTSVIV